MDSARLPQDIAGLVYHCLQEMAGKHFS